MMQLNCIIVEDEPLACEKLEGFIALVPELELLKSFDNALDAMSYINSNKIDILFLDIQMEQFTGIQLLEVLPAKPYVIIVSAYEQYALKGYELEVFDYLLKPFNFDRFVAAVNKVFADVKTKTQVNSSAAIFIKSEYKHEQVNPHDILYVQGMREYLRIVLPSRKIMTKLKFSDILEMLPQNLFIQVHKSWVVSINKIEYIERERIKIGSEFIPIGKSYKQQVKNLLL